MPPESMPPRAKAMLRPLRVIAPPFSLVSSFAPPLSLLAFTVTLMPFRALVAADLSRCEEPESSDAFTLKLLPNTSVRFLESLVLPVRFDFTLKSSP